MIEVKKLQGYEDEYSIDEYGLVMSLERDAKHSNRGTTRKVPSKKLSEWRNRKGYVMVTLCKNAKKKSYPVSILVATMFVPNPDNKPEVNHLDGDKENNHKSNLEWATRLENQHHSIHVLGKHFYGEKHALAKLTEHDVINIIQLHKTGNYTYAEISRMYNMEETQINRIVKRKSWKHLKIA
jgi:hypothetical protein